MTANKSTSPSIMNKHCNKLYTGSRSQKARRRPRIGLISPYTGGNLGDAAIIETVRDHLKRLFPEAEFLLIAIDCEAVSRIHDVDSFPLTAVPLNFYYSLHTNRISTLDEKTQFSAGGTKLFRLRVRSALKRGAGSIPLLSKVARRLWKGSGMIVFEVRHLLQVIKIVRNLDVLLVAGGGQFDDEFGGPWGHPYAIFKWISLARRARVPVYFAGVGVCEIRYALTGCFLRRALVRASRVSLRDIGSMEILRGLGIKRELIQCPDLAFGMPPIDHAHAAEIVEISQLRRPLIGLSPIVYGRPGSWPTAKPALFERYWREFRGLAVSLLEANYSLRIFVTDEGDNLLAKMLYDELVETVTDKECFQLLRLSKVTELITALQTCDAVIASRLHGVLLSHVSGVPVLAISYHRKVRVHMEDMGQERKSLDFETFTGSEVRNSLHSLLTERHTVISEIKATCADKYRAVEREFIPISKVLASLTDLSIGHTDRGGM